MIVEKKEKADFNDILIKDGVVTRVHSYNYLSITIDNKLLWKSHVDSVVKKMHSRLYCVRKLRSFNAHSEFLQLLYTSVICSTVTFCLFAGVRAESIAKKERDKLNKNIKKAGEAIGRGQNDVEMLFHKLLYNRLITILADDSHSLLQ